MNLKHRRTLTKLSMSAGIIAAACAAATIILTIQLATANNQTQPISSRAAFLRAQRANTRQQTTPNTQNEPRNENNNNNNKPTTAQNTDPKQPPKAAGQGSAIETSAPITTAAVAVAASTAAAAAPTTTTTTTTGAINPTQTTSVNQAQQPAVASNRATRTADVFQGGEGFNIFVTNTCERELMRVNIKTSRPFYGVIHTRNQRQKSACSVEGNGDTEYNLDISHVLNPQDSAYCGVIKARKDSPEDKDLLSVVIAVRVHRNIELSDDKFFLLNCTNRCRRPDCSTPSSRLTNLNSGENQPSGRLVNPETETELGERESPTDVSGGQASPQDKQRPKNAEEDECTIWKFPWVITLLWCLGILLLAMIISHCIMCSSLVCRCVRTEVEEREPSVYEGATDDEDSLYNKRNHPMRIDYDNKGVYKTSNNYEPYSLEEVQAKSRQSKKKDHNGTKRTSARC